MFQAVQALLPAMALPLPGYLTNRFLPDKDGTRDLWGDRGGKPTKPLNDHQSFWDLESETYKNEDWLFCQKDAFSKVQAHHITNYIEWEEMKWMCFIFFG